MEKIESVSMEAMAEALKNMRDFKSKPKVDKVDIVEGHLMYDDVAIAYVGHMRLK